MTKLNLKWSFSNRKVSKLDAVSFGIPAYRSANGFKTCPQAGVCAGVCYARQGSYLWPATKAAREFNLTKTQWVHNFILEAEKDLKRIKQSLIRIHDSGDFYSQDYVDAWIYLARSFPNKIFYTDTKSIHLNFTHAPPNLKITQSEGGKLDHLIDKTKPHSRIFATDSARKAENYQDGNKTDKPAISGVIKIGLVYHGNKKLTESQQQIFK